MGCVTACFRPKTALADAEEESPSKKKGRSAGPSKDGSGARKKVSVVRKKDREGSLSGSDFMNEGLPDEECSESSSLLGDAAWAAGAGRGGMGRGGSSGDFRSSNSNSNSNRNINGDSNSEKGPPAVSILPKVKPRGAAGSVSGASSSSTKSSVAPSALSSHPEVTQADEMLLESFYANLDQGILLTLHKANSNKQKAVKQKQLKLSLVGLELRWQMRGRILNKSGSLSLKLVRRVQWGKKTDIFMASDNAGVDENCCFSLVTDEYTIDLQCSSRLERDLMARGFSMIIASMDKKYSAAPATKYIFNR